MPLMPAPLRRRFWLRLVAPLASWLGVALLCSAPLPVHAQQCFVNGAFGMGFGTVTTNGKGATSSVQYSCQNHAVPVAYFHLCVFMGPGNFSAGQSTRRMSNYNGAYLNYDLFSDAAHTSRIGAPGTTPVYKFTMTVANGQQLPATAAIYGWVYPAQSVPASSNFQEQGIPGTLRYRYSNAEFTSPADCSGGGQGGGSVSFDSSGVTAQFDNSCQAQVTASDLDFGPTPPPGTPISATSNIAVSCPPQTAWQLGLNNGLHHSSGSRRMAGAGGYIPYEMYRDASHSQPWGNVAGTTYSSTTPANGGTVNVTVYGRVPALPTAAPGTYADTITVTLTY
jgi:spore coat protein U-like protein